MDRKFLSIKQAAEMSSLSTRYLYQQCKDRKLRHSVIGERKANKKNRQYSRIVIDEQDLIEFITRKTVEPVENWTEKLGLGNKV